ncbi:GCG_CRPN prefix-to-repeats domain-containing protein [Legionella sp. D16C41]|uniref:GCG_CRPN prefix-to-repeats domain-containing protein n=1 Tax=Legionella sp. D16C41 TaxID=3402688 RepID=UPI003AF95B56
MEIKSMHLPKFLGTLAVGTVLTVGVLTSSMSYAAQGCGYGFHRFYGRCVPNSPGPNAVPVRGRPNCWINGAGQLRCWR